MGGDIRRRHMAAWRHGGGGTGGDWWKCYWDVVRGDVGGKRMDALGNIAVAVLVVTSGNIIRMW